MEDESTTQTHRNNWKWKTMTSLKFIKNSQEDTRTVRRQEQLEGDKNSWEETRTVGKRQEQSGDKNSWEETGDLPVP